MPVHPSRASPVPAGLPGARAPPSRAAPPPRGAGPPGPGARRPRPGGAGGAAERRPRQRGQPASPGALAPRAGAGDPPGEAPPAVRAAAVRRVGARHRPDPGPGGRGGALPHVLRPAQRAGARAGHGGGPRAESGGRAVRGRAPVLRDAGVGAGRPGCGAPAGPREPGPPGPPRGAGRQGAGDQSHLRHDDAARAPGSPRARGAGGRGAPRRGGHGSGRVPVGHPRGAAVQRRLPEHPRSDRVPGAVSPAGAGRGLPRARPPAPDPGGPREHGARVLRPRRHLRDDRRGVRALRPDRAEGDRRPPRGRRGGVGDRLPAGRPAVRAARRPPSAPPDVDPGPRVSPGRLPRSGAGRPRSCRRGDAVARPVASGDRLAALRIPRWGAGGARDAAGPPGARRAAARDAAGTGRMAAPGPPAGARRAVGLR